VESEGEEGGWQYGRVSDKVGRERQCIIWESAARRSRGQVNDRRSERDR
jgi:hypothetical protein